MDILYRSTGETKGILNCFREYRMTSLIEEVQCRGFGRNKITPIKTIGTDIIASSI